MAWRHRRHRLGTVSRRPVVGRLGAEVAKRIDVLAAAIHLHMTVDAFSDRRLVLATTGHALGCGPDRLAGVVAERQLWSAARERRRRHLPPAGHSSTSRCGSKGRRTEDLTRPAVEALTDASSRTRRSPPVGHLAELADVDRGDVAGGDDLVQLAWSDAQDRCHLVDVEAPALVCLQRDVDDQLLYFVDTPPRLGTLSRSDGADLC